MARVELPIVVINSATGLPVNGASVAVAFRATGAPASWYPTETGGAASTAAVVTDSNGRTSAWFPRGAYNCTVTGTGITPYTEPWDAAPASDQAIDSLWVPDGSIGNAKLGTDLDAGKLTTGTLPAARIGANAIGTSNIADGSITYQKMAASSSLRFLAAVDLLPFSVGANGTAQLISGTSVTVTHNNRPCYVFFNHFGQVGSATSGGVSFQVIRNGSVNVGLPLNASKAAGALVFVSSWLNAGTMSGPQDWSAIASLANNPTTWSSNSLGELVIFEG